MSVLVVGSLAFDSIRSPFGEVEEVLGGSAAYFSLAASFFSPVRMVSVVGRDFPAGAIRLFEERGVDTAGLVVAEGKTFRWKGYYEFDLNMAHTVSTELNVFRDFAPRLPEAYRHTPYLFLGNIDPRLQLAVLEQVRRPRLVALDTMNYWIEHAPGPLREAIARADVLLVNESEARQLSGHHNLVKAARTIMGWGPRRIVIKRGEYGVLQLADGTMFAAPAYPLEEIFDPTGAGDSFAGGFMGYLASRGDAPLGEADFRRAALYGSAVASFAVEAFSVERLAGLTAAEIEERLKAFCALTGFSA